MNLIFKEIVDINEINNLGKLNHSDILILKDCDETFPCHHNVMIKNKVYGRKSGLFINKLYESNKLPIPDHFIEYNDNYYENLLNPNNQISMDIVAYTQSGGAMKYYQKYIKYKKKYLFLKNQGKSI